MRESTAIIAKLGIAIGLLLGCSATFSLAADTEFATPTEALMGHRTQYATEMAQALAFIKPTFNEDMRGGHTNM